MQAGRSENLASKCRFFFSQIGNNYLVNDGSEICSDLVVGDGVLGGSFIQPDLEEQVKALLLVGGAILLPWHSLSAAALGLPI